MDSNRISVLLQKCKENDKMAQHELFNAYKQKVYDLSYRSLGGNFDIDDVVQQIFIAIFGSLGQFKGMSSFDTWVYRITVKICTTQLRKKYRKRQPQISYDSVIAENDRGDLSNGSLSCDALAVLERKELTQSIYQAFNKLSPEKRMIVILYEMEGRTLEEIALILKKPLGTVKSRLFHGRKALKKHLSGCME
jgi:RNA polymerase sigma-70 factor (ECF subfamily)